MTDTADEFVPFAREPTLEQRLAAAEHAVELLEEQLELLVVVLVETHPELDWRPLT